MNSPVHCDISFIFVRLSRDSTCFVKRSLIIQNTRVICDYAKVLKFGGDENKFAFFNGNDGIW